MVQYQLESERSGSRVSDSEPLQVWQLRIRYSTRTGHGRRGYRHRAALSDSRAPLAGCACGGIQSAEPDQFRSAGPDFGSRVGRRDQPHGDGSQTASTDRPDGVVRDTGCQGQMRPAPAYFRQVFGPCAHVYVQSKYIEIAERCGPDRASIASISSPSSESARGSGRGQISAWPEAAGVPRHPVARRLCVPYRTWHAPPERERWFGSGRGILQEKQTRRNLLPPLWRCSLPSTCRRNRLLPLPDMPANPETRASPRRPECWGCSRSAERAKAHERSDPRGSNGPRERVQFGKASFGSE